MSGDHNTGWRKRQIALDIKAENARELGLDYEPDKTIMDMAREAGFEGGADLTWEGVTCTEELEAFAALVRADEREACAKLCEEYAIGLERNYSEIIADKIRARGNT